MTQAYPFGDANQKYRKKLFVDTGVEYQEVQAKIVEPYSPPAPQPAMKEIKVINGPSHLHQLGLSSYRCSMRLLFQDKQSYSDYLMFSGWTHKFYDEKGHMYLGSLTDIKPVAREASRRYTVDIELVLIKKDSYKVHDRFSFQDVGEDYWNYEDIREMANLGLITVVSPDGQPMLYFRPNDRCTRAEFVVFLMRTKRFMEKAIRE